MPETFAQFESRLKAQGYDEVLERKWEPGQVVALHTHPFDAQAVVVQGEMWVTVDEFTAHVVTGGGFEMGRGTPHSELYGSEGAIYWVARRH